MIAIIDYDAGNLKSVEKAFLALGEELWSREIMTAYAGQTEWYCRVSVLWNGNAAAEKI